MLSRRIGAEKRKSIWFIFSSPEDSIKQVIEGLKVYFEKALGNILLYRFERPQYVQLLREYPAKSLCEIYGPEHLLRLFGMHAL
jgi:mortality factor 4-like protein 1